MAANAAHALAHALASLVSPEGVPQPELHAGVAAPSAEELARWEQLDDPLARLAEEGVAAVSEDAARDLYVRTWATPSLDVNGIAGGEPSLLKTIIPAAAIANVSVRLAPGQRARRIADALEHLLLAALPARCAVETTVLAAADPGSVDPHDPIVRAAADAFERATGTRPVSVREGGTLPVFASLAERGIAPIMTGFTLPEDNIHAPNERFRLDHLPLGVTTAQEMIAAIANAASAAPDGDGAHAVTTPII